MAAGDIKGEVGVDTFVELLTFGNTVAKGDLIHYESDQKYDPTVDGDTGPFAVAIEAGVDTNEKRAVTQGLAEVTFYGGTAAKRGTPLKPGATAGTVTVSATFGSGINCGTAAEPMDTSGNTYTMWVGKQTN